MNPQENLEVDDLELPINHTPLDPSDDPIYTQSTTDQKSARWAELEELKPDMERIREIKEGRILRQPPVSKSDPTHPKQKHKLNEAPFRTVLLRYEPEDVGPEIIDIVLKRWEQEIPLEAILHQVNTRIRAENRLCLSLPDLYAILAHAKAADKITQRRKPQNELSLKKFAEVFQVWQNGGTCKQCIAAAAPFTNKYFIDKCFRALMERHRRTLRQERCDTAVKGLPTTAAEFDKSVLRVGHRQTVDGHACIVIPIRKIPPHLLEYIKTLSAGDRLLYDPAPETVLPPELDLKVKPKHVESTGLESEPVETTPATTAFDDASIDELFQAPAPPAPDGTPDPFDGQKD
jgi:hypothetical protein